jgi:hypothetical protein
MSIHPGFEFVPLDVSRFGLDANKLPKVPIHPGNKYVAPHSIRHPVNIKDTGEFQGLYISILDRKSGKKELIYVCNQTRQDLAEIVFVKATGTVQMNLNHQHNCDFSEATGHTGNESDICKNCRILGGQGSYTQWHESVITEFLNDKNLLYMLYPVV